MATNPIAHHATGHCLRSQPAMHVTRKSCQMEKHSASASWETNTRLRSKYTAALPVDPRSSLPHFSLSCPRFNQSILHSSLFQPNFRLSGDG